MIEVLKMYPLWYYVLMLIMLLICFILIIFYKKIIGGAGEHWTKKELKKLNKNYYVINDLMINVNGISYQIDHVVVSKYGIFVIETKHYNGYITGNEYDKKWIINKKYYINNPIHQNYGHVLALKELLNLSEDKFIPIVCITSNAKVKVKSSSFVLRNYNLIENMTKINDIRLNNVGEIYNYLVNSNIVDKKARKNHIKYAKIVKKKKEVNSVNKCPKCGGDLVNRTGKYGNFIGCSNYPKCKYIKK